ncbi:MAG: CPXCG motif-containing cysteine-rich protein [Rudaea sp.]|uniref:CPXCG motif-containing cysteine-rich protein n=1 Tax=Rudaea sp. TaxID=2136325 RepID=UPI0039E29E1C
MSDTALEFVRIDCPYCGESFETQVDLSAGSQSYIEDCAVCCKPIEIVLRVDDEGKLLEVMARTDQE